MESKRAVFERRQVSKKGGDKRTVGNSERSTAVGLCIAGLRAAGICNDFMQEPKSFGTNSTGTIHKSCAASSKHPRKQVHR